MRTHAALKQYQQIGVHTAVTDASPHRLVQMLMEGVLEKIALARGNMSRREIARKGENIGKAITIIGGLQAALNKDAGGELADNLGGLYEYMTRRLLEANLKNDANILDEIAGLMLEIKKGWDAIPDLLKR